MASEPDPLMTAVEVARWLRVSTMTVRRWVASGELEGLRAGRGYRLRRADVERFVGMRSADVTSAS